MSETDSQHAHDANSSWLSRIFSLFPFKLLSPVVDSEDDTDSDPEVPAVESGNNLDIDPSELQRLQRLEVASQQSNNPYVRRAALSNLRELAQAPPLPSSPLLSLFAFRVLGKFLAIERIPKEDSSGDDYDRLIFSAVSALWAAESYYSRGWHIESNNPDDKKLDDCVLILQKALQWINFFHAHFFSDLTQNVHLRENAWTSSLGFLDTALQYPKMFDLFGDEITLSIVNLWVLEAAPSNPVCSTKHIPARLLHKLIDCHGEDYEYMITGAMESVGPSVAAQTAIHHLSSILAIELESDLNAVESDLHILAMRNETLLLRMMVCTMTLAHPLLSKGLLRVLVKTLSHATRESYTDDPMTSRIMIWLVQNSCEALQVAMTRSTGVAMCRQALEFGILAPLLRADKWHTHLTPKHFPNAPYIHSRLLIQILATYTIYPCVLRAAVIAIEKVPVKLQAKLDKTGPMRAAWKQFKDEVQMRSQVPGAPAGPSDSLICSNLFCPLPSPEDLEGASKRCAGCETVVYCGSACQKVDWKNHKKLCKEMQALNDGRPTVPKEETEFAYKVALHELESHKNFILQHWRTNPDNRSPGTIEIHPDGRSSHYEDPSPKIQVVILDYEVSCTSDKPGPTIGFVSAPMFEHIGLPTMEESAQRYRQEWNAIKSLAEKCQKPGMRHGLGIVVVRIPEGLFTVRKFFSLLPYSMS
ncbi:hypothetical protein GGX14DRAFT_481330 [Mycena pura]|uniref:MYND-type domain-containing protein n=1 Tax=Mycena pura TaxID=153505 RepID=A0AAD6XXF8_9AGAR|nr:hypothetical protein GGX14DRAFT_481330 [Mycena pura]